MIHPIDRLGALALERGPDRLRFFRDGWGEESALLDAVILPSGDPQPADITWSAPSAREELRLATGVFDTGHVDLPGWARPARVFEIAPAEATGRVVVLMAAWNEHESKSRIALAVRLADAGIASWILEHPMYGTRRPGPPHHQPVRTVTDFMLMGRAAIEEGRALLAALEASGRRAGIAGYSMGGNLAALISATMPSPVATAPLAAPYSPAPVYLSGALRGGVDWEALRRDGNGAAPMTRPEVEARLGAIMDSASVLSLDAPRHAAAAVLVGARRDGYVPSSATTRLHRHWPGSELRWVAGGHATLLWARKRLLVQAIVDSFRRVHEVAG